MAQNLIYSINGPVVTIKGKTGLSMMEMVHVGNDHLVGEVIRMDEELTTIQVYEETSGLAPGEPVTTTGGPLCVTLGPGILRNIYDGIQRPLPALEKESGPFIARGCNIPSLDPDAKWDVTVTVKVGSVTHPMLSEHSITMIAAVTGDTVTLRFPKPGDAPELRTFSKGGSVEAYEICNLHGFWKGEG